MSVTLSVDTDYSIIKKYCENIAGFFYEFPRE